MSRNMKGKGKKNLSKQIDYSRKLYTFAIK